MAALPPPRGRGRIRELEGLRGLLAWTVVATHILICSGWFGPIVGGENVLSAVAESAVDVFMLLSGFVITRLLLVEREPFGKYLWRRACRIVPAYWVALAAGIALNGTLAANLRHLPPTPEARAFVLVCDLGASRVWTDATLHALLLHGLVPARVLPQAAYTFLGVAWSLSLEWQFYCVAPLALAFALRTRIGFIGLAVFCLTNALVCGRWIAEFSNAFLLAKVLFFFVGAVGYVAIAENTNRRRAALWLVGGCSLLAAAWFVGSRRWLEATLPALIWIVALGCAQFNSLGAVRRLLCAAPLQYLGRVSYSTYLFHAPVITVVQFTMWRWVHPTSRPTLLILTAIPSVVTTLIVSHLAWRWIEQPFQQLGRRRVPRS